MTDNSMLMNGLYIGGVTALLSFVGVVGMVGGVAQTFSPTPVAMSLGAGAVAGISYSILDYFDYLK